MKVTYPNGSMETWAEHPKILLSIEAPNPFGGNWRKTIKHGIHNQSTGNAGSDSGIKRRGARWSLGHDKDGWRWLRIG